MEIIVSGPDSVSTHEIKTQSTQIKSKSRSPNATKKSMSCAADAYDFGASLEQEKLFSSRFRRYKAKARNIGKLMLNYQNSNDEQENSIINNDLASENRRPRVKPLSEYKYLPPKHVYRAMNMKSLNESSRIGNQSRLLDSSIQKYIELFENTQIERKTLQLQEASEHHQFLPKIRNFHTNLQAIVFVGKLRATVRRNNEGKTKVDYAQLRLQLRNVQKAVKIMEKNNCDTFDDLEKHLLKCFKEEQISDIIQAILKELPHSRTLKQKKLVGLWLKSRFIPKTKALKDRELTEDDIQLLATNLTLITLDANELLFRQGDMAKAFYMILNGSVGVLIEKTENDSASNGSQLDRFQTHSKSSKINRKNYRNGKSRTKKVQATKVASLLAGVSFGELGLLATNPKDAVRKATIIAETGTTLIVMDSNTFKTVVKFDAANAENKEITKKKEFFQSFSMWSSLPSEMMMQFCIVIEKEVFEKGEMIIPFLEWQNKKQSEKTETVYWMQNGSVDFLIPKCIKTVPASQKSIENYNKMIDSVLAWNPKNVTKHCETVSKSSGQQLLGLDRTILYLDSQSNALSAPTELIHMPLAARATSQCTVYKMYLKNFFQFLQKTAPSMQNHFSQLCLEKQRFCDMIDIKRNAQSKFAHFSQTRIIQRKKRNKTMFATIQLYGSTIADQRAVKSITLPRRT